MTDDREMDDLAALHDAGTLTTEGALRLMYLLHGSVEGGRMTETAIQRAVREGLAEIEASTSSSAPRAS